MKKNKQNNYRLGDVVGRNFIRACKDNNLYSTFMNAARNKRNEIRTPYEGTVGHISDVFNLIEQNARGGAGGQTPYDHVVYVINTLLQYYLERSGVKPNSLGRYGQEIYDRSCTTLFGDKFQEENMLPEGVREPRNEFERMALGIYLNLTRHGKALDLTFDQFLRQHGNTLKRHFGMTNMVIDEEYDEEETSYYGDVPREVSYFDSFRN